MRFSHSTAFCDRALLIHSGRLLKFCSRFAFAQLLPVPCFYNLIVSSPAKASLISDVSISLPCLASFFFFSSSPLLTHLFHKPGPRRAQSKTGRKGERGSRAHDSIIHQSSYVGDGGGTRRRRGGGGRRRREVSVGWGGTLAMVAGIAASGHRASRLDWRIRKEHKGSLGYSVSSCCVSSSGKKHTHLVILGRTIPLYMI